MLAEPFAWVEDFSGGLNGWVSNKPSVWQIGDDGKLTYADQPGTGFRTLRSPQPVNLTNGFRIRLDIEDFKFGFGVSDLGIMFNADEDTQNFNFYRHSDTLSSSSSIRSFWSLTGQAPGITSSFAFGYMPRIESNSRTLDLEYDGRKLDIKLQGELIHSYKLFPGPPPRNISDNTYLGVAAWDSRDSSPDSAIINSIAYGPHPIVPNIPQKGFIDDFTSRPGEPIASAVTTHTEGGEFIETSIFDDVILPPARGTTSIPVSFYRQVDNSFFGIRPGSSLTSKLNTTEGTLSCDAVNLHPADRFTCFVNYDFEVPMDLSRGALIRIDLLNHTGSEGTYEGNLDGVEFPLVRAGNSLLAALDADSNLADVERFYFSIRYDRPGDENIHVLMDRIIVVPEPSTLVIGPLLLGFLSLRLRRVQR